MNRDAAHQTKICRTGGALALVSAALSALCPDAPTLLRIPSGAGRTTAGASPVNALEVGGGTPTAVGDSCDHDARRTHGGGRVLSLASSRSRTDVSGKQARIIVLRTATPAPLVHIRAGPTLDLDSRDPCCCHLGGRAGGRRVGGQAYGAPSAGRASFGVRDALCGPSIGAVGLPLADQTVHATASGSRQLRGSPHHRL